MDVIRLQKFIERIWETEVMPTLRDYVAIPCESPAFDPHWSENGHMDRAVDLLARWARDKLGAVPGASVEVVRLPRRTPVIFADIPGDTAAPLVIYGHLDKQPPMTGWAPGRGPWTPVIEGDRLYGRGGADDGYSIFSAVAAILALREQCVGHPRCMILIEASEESGSVDLPDYVDHLAPRIGAPAVIVVLDAGCGSYDRLWLTTSLRGQIAGVLTVRVLHQGIHSGDAAGVVPSSFRIARQLPWLQGSLDEASQQAFGSPGALIGGGGGIPFLAMLVKRFPQAQFVVTGVLGPESNAHGPNEFLHLPTAKRIAAVVAHVLHTARRNHVTPTGDEYSPAEDRSPVEDTTLLHFAPFLHL